jgi:hypothetical protein
MRSHSVARRCSDLGGGDLEDEVYAAEFLKKSGYVETKRIESGELYGDLAVSIIMAVSA